jgi:solute carrier family 13 (sodium-dependent dicarboxylate transporter), member 2/3/5
MTARKAFLFILVTLVAFVLTLMLKSEELSQSAVLVMFLLFWAVGLWASEAIPAFAVGILILGFLVYALGSGRFTDEPKNVIMYVNQWSSPIIWLMLGGFFLAEGMRKTKYDEMLFRNTIKLFGKKPPFVLLGMMTVTAVLSSITSNTATTAMMIAAALPFLRTLPPERPIVRSLLIGIPAAASFGGMATIIGSPPNAVAVGSLDSMGKGLNFIEWMGYGIPLSIMCVIGFWLYLLKRFPLWKNKVDIVFPELPETAQATRANRLVVLITLTITIGMWLTSSLHLIPVAVVSAIPIVLLTMTGVIDAEEMRQMPWDTLMLVTGGLALGMAIMDTGLAVHYISQINIENISLFPTLLVFGYLTAILSNFMSNTAASTILIPIAATLVPDHAIEAALTIAFCASTALMLPVSTPPNAIAYSTGMVKQQDFYQGGTITALVYPLLITGMVLLLTSLF